MKKLGLYAAGALALMIGGATLWSWFRPPISRTIYRQAAPIYIAGPTKIVEKIKTVEKKIPVTVYVPTPAQAEKLGLKEPSGNLLAVVEINPAPYGATATVMIPNAVPENPFPKAVVTVEENKQPFIEWLGTREASAWYGYDANAKKVWSAELEQDLWRTGPAVWKVRAGVMGDSLAGTRAYGLVGVGVKF